MLGNAKQIGHLCVCIGCVTHVLVYYHIIIAHTQLCFTHVLDVYLCITM